MKTFGYELILDLSGCNADKFNREELTYFFIELCDLIDMNRENLYFWDYEGCEDQIPYDQPHLVGTTAVQFISTSDIVVHTLDLLEKVFVNIFSCKKFDNNIAENFVKDFFEAKDCRVIFIERK